MVFRQGNPRGPLCRLGCPVLKRRRAVGESPTSDLLKWQESLKTAKILKRESIGEMESPRVRANVDGSDAYGYGLAVKSIYDDGSDRQIEFVYDGRTLRRVFFVSEGLKIELKKVK